MMVNNQPQLIDVGRVNYLGQRMLQRVCYCGPQPQAIVYNSKPQGS